MPSPLKPSLIAIIGPTAVGKTALALWLGARLPIEVVSADSRQVYRGMDIGTAKPTPAEQRQLPHHLVSIVNPDESFTLAQYQSLAYEAIGDILHRGKLPLFVGGTGLYVRAVLEGLTIPVVPPDPKLRESLFAQATQEGEIAFHERLRRIDPVAAERLDPRNVRRVVRALEVCLKTGRPISEQQRREPPPYRTLKIGLTMPREVLYERVDHRVDAMIASGLVKEVQGLVARGYGCELPAMSGLGYQQIGLYLRGEATLDEAIVLIKRHTRRFIRHQYNWFHPNDPEIRWFDPLVCSYETIFEVIQTHLNLPDR
jgi:tRNA dimethylallyltransferase